MIAIRYENSAVVRHQSTARLDVGATFTGRIGEHEGLFLKTYRGVIVFLNDPSVTWTDVTLSVCDYRPVNVEIVVREVI